MKLYVTYTSPYARLARIVVMEKTLEDRVEIVEAKTRTRDSPYYQINPSGRVPYLVDDAGNGIRLRHDRRGRPLGQAIELLDLGRIEHL